MSRSARMDAELYTHSWVTVEVMAEAVAEVAAP